MSQGLHCMVEVVITTVDIDRKSLYRAKPLILRLLAARAERFDKDRSQAPLKVLIKWEDVQEDLGRWEISKSL